MSPTLGAQFKSIPSFCIYANNSYTSNGLFIYSTRMCEVREVPNKETYRKHFKLMFIHIFYTYI